MDEGIVHSAVMKVVLDVLDVEMSVETGQKLTREQVLIEEHLMFVERFRHGLKVRPGSGSERAQRSAVR
jgi:hypothetical protein